MNAESKAVATLWPTANTKIVVTWHKCLADVGILDFGLEASGYTVYHKVLEGRVETEYLRYKSTRLHRTLNRAVRLHLQIYEAAQIVAKDSAAGIRP